MNILALDIGGTAIKYALGDETGRLACLGETPTRAELGGEHIPETILQILRNYPEAEAIGISTAGQVETQTGRILYATDNIPCYTGLPLGKLIAQASGLPVMVENDVHAAALGELVFGCGGDFHSFLFITYGTGIGGAMVWDGRLMRGEQGTAGYFGHILTHPGGRLCTCGQRGCYETYASTTALLQRVEEVTGRKMTGRELFRDSMTEPVRNCRESWIDEVMWGLVSLINAVNPAAVVLGGGIMKEGTIIESLRRRLPSYLPPMSRNISVLASTLGNTAGMLGMIHLCSQAHGHGFEGGYECCKP